MSFVQLRVAVRVVFAIAVIGLSNLAFASADPPPTPGPVVSFVPSSQPTPPSPPPTPIPTVPPLPPIVGPRPLPTAPPTARSLIDFGPSATVVLPTSAASVVSYSINGIFQLVNLPQDQVAQVVVQYPTTTAAEVVKVEALDGGLLGASVSGTVPEVNLGAIIAMASTRVDTGTISAHGTFTFVFRPAHPPGLYQIRVTRGTEVLGLQFWVSDPQHASHNPPGLAPRPPEVPSPNPI